jgi:hypothetical protein
MDPKTKWFHVGWRSAAMFALLATVVVRSQPQGFSFFTLDPAYAQHLFGVASSFLNSPPQKGYLGGVVVLQNGDVIAAECQTSVTRLHRFSATDTYTDPEHDTVLHTETISSALPGGCGIALHPDGAVYSNMFEGPSGFGVSRIDLETGDVDKMGLPGNALGIAVDPVTLNLVYAGQGCKPAFGPPPCVLFELNPVTEAVTNFIVLDPAQFGYIDGLAFDPTGEFLFLTNRFPTFDLVVIKRTTGTAAVVQKVPLAAEPVGLGFHATSPKFVLTNNQNGTLTRIDFPRDDYTAAPALSDFATGGFRGDLMQAGPDGCLYLTQDGARYDDGEDGRNTENSIVQICDGFATPPGITPDPPPPPSSLCGFAYNDVDNDGVRDAAEPAIPGVAVALAGMDHRGRAVASGTTTASDGAYCFNNLRAGTYTIAETQPAGYQDGKDTQGTPGTGTTGNDRFTNIALAAGVQGQNNNFGELLPSSLCGYVYIDADNNGIRIASEAGIGGVPVTITGTDDLGAAVSMPTATGADGAYCFMGLRPGTYTIRETQPTGYVDGKDTQGTPGTGTTGNDVFSNIALSQNVNGQNNNFGEIAPAPAVAIVKKTNGTDNDTGTGPKVAVGSTVTWTYVVSNTGNVALSSVAVTDDKAGPVTCPATTLAVGASMTCTKTGKAVKDQYTNVGTVTATGMGGTVTAQNGDRYFGLAPEQDRPTCTLEYFKGPPHRTVMRFYDSGSGIVKLEITQQTNMNIVLPTFTGPSPGPLVVTGTRINASKAASMTVKATDFFGNAEWCDPVVTTVTRLKQDKGIQTHTNIPAIEHIVTIMNDAPGLRRLDVIVNGRIFAAKRLEDYEILVIDVASAMRDGSNNTITLVPRGKKGESALVVIADH